MDPGGPWSYASYNRLAAVQGEPPAGAPPTTSSQILSGGFLSPSPVSYETVFSPLFHHANTKPAAHYVTQHRMKQDVEYPQYFDQGAAWQPNSPFGILPHESVVPTTTSKSYENFNHFTPNHLNSQLVATKLPVTRAQSPAVSKPPATFFQAETKSFTPVADSSPSSCIVSSSSSRVVSNRAYLKPTPQVQTKAPSKVYVPPTNTRDLMIPKEEPQSSPISFINYNKRTPPQFQNNYRHYPQNEQDFQRPKSTDYNSNGPDCSVVVPRRPSPLQAHSQASPIGHASSPAYPMYNSPMNSMSSPQSSNHVTPPSPLDVSVPRASTQSANVGYSSVITRTSEKNFNDRYERQSGNQSCWEDRQNATRKFPNGTQPNNYNTVPLEQRLAQQSYFDSNGPQLNLQDLSSCRGDPMSIVKNLQQQQSCQVPSSSIEVKLESKPPDKRRKSGEKNDVGRIPPPAHTSAVQNQQQNGAYFDFDRWNLPPPPPTTKMFSGQSLHQQHQTLMVPHPHTHHPPATLPYFPPFHLPPHPSAEYPTNVELPPINTYSASSNEHHNSTQLPTDHYQAPPSEEPPKVVVPNIEEELNFLSQTSISNRVKPPPKGKILGSSGFMSSYLKFLQGDRDCSPPPISRNNRKQNFTKQSEEEKGPSESNGSAPPVSLSPPIIKRLSQQGDPQDDPRYFPLPKERKRNSFDSDTDDGKSDEDFFNNKKSLGLGLKKKRQKGEKKRQKRIPKMEEIIPRREVSRRAAKEKNNFRHLERNDDDIEEPMEFQDSDSDPAWTPQAKDDVEEVTMIKKGKRNAGRKRKNLVSGVTQSTPIVNEFGIRSNKIKAKGGALTLEDNIAASLSKTTIGSNDENPFKPGEFLVMKSELVQEYPAIWKVDGKSLLQKFEPFNQNGSTFYKNISTYTSWTPESQKQYISVPVRTKYQTPTETIVEFLRNEMTCFDPEYQQQCIKDCESFQDNFEVYIQTLISQALDSNFLTEIFQEKDEYFLSNVKIIDGITESKKKKLLCLLRWPPTVQAAVCTWPCFNVIREVNPIDIRTQSCDACTKYEVAVRMLMYGQPYNSTTLEGCQPDPKAMNEKNFLMCRICADRVQLANKVTHQKYLMYIECAKKVSEKRSGDPSKDTTCILNELLADENWLNQLFYEVRTAWAEVDCIEYSINQKNSVFT